MMSAKLRTLLPASFRPVRFAVKCGLFALFAALVLNPNLRLLILQAKHTVFPEALVEARFPALPLINRRIDHLMTEENDLSEVRAVEKFVFRRIHYLTDYDNWNNVEYWPSAPDVWARGQEDCDGRAILAASILRSRGFSSARLVVGLDHMWVRVNKNEKDPSRSPEWVAILSPGKDLSLDLADRTTLEHLIKLARALLNPQALYETVANLLSEIPPFRKALLALGLLVLCYHPCRHRTGLLALMALALLGVAILPAGPASAGKPDPLTTGAGCLLLAASLLGALFMQQLLRLNRDWIRKPILAERIVRQDGQEASG